ncbi:MAG: DsbA family protein [Pyrinomonadaceae bacterium]
MNNKNQSNSSNLPFVIIGLVLLVALVGGWFFYQNSKSQTNKPLTANVNKTGNSNKTPGQTAEEIYTKALPGAQPPNMLGSPAAAVTVEEFADYQCATCGTQHPKMKQLTGLYGNRIKFIYRSYPLIQIHKNAYNSAVAAEAAGLQGKFWAMQDQLFTNRQEWENSPEARKKFEEYAQKLGLDVPKFQNDVLGLPAKSRVDADMQRGRSLTLNGTPTIFINGKQLTPEQMEVETMRQIIDAELQKATTQTQPNQSANTANSSNTNTNQTTNSANTPKGTSNNSGEKK